ncbi:MAG: ABC transporter permease [Chloroflexi bacterium]|nr:MAG: binding-protein-dependent transport system inner membrane protein [Chloroflexi bacterium OLB13]MBC6954958.1 ABC transporter permease [Chloroflexota bacterium]MBV6437404.1 Oligopeptide transport system permease protein OppC [Anaerolineae bacterium]MDL1914675.1 ABC transporter permease [Anaerolineae bacterium CFX4]MBW7879106.1 ABC transporter permease [Anaerolineae bacterium]
MERGTVNGTISLDDANRKHESLLQLVFARFRRHRMAMIGVAVMTLITLYVIGGSFFITERSSNSTDFQNKWGAPSAEHPFGTDALGRDVLARTIYGGQVTLLISLLAMVVTAIVGTTLGLISGFYGGWIDSIVMRVSEALLTIPLLFLLLVITKFIGSQVPAVKVFGREFSGSVIVVIFVLGFTGWMGLARIVRAQVLSLREQEFVTAARALGARNLHIIFRHIMPNALAPVIVYTTLGISNVILLEAYIGFLGMGVQPPTASWGNMIQRATEKIDSAWWMWLYPGGLILLTVISINYIGDGLRDALDPYSKK